jgi:hypothetical protein
MALYIRFIQSIVPIRRSHPVVGKTRWVFRQPHGLSTEWLFYVRLTQWNGSLDWTHSADGRPSGSSLQAIEQALYKEFNKSET